MKIRASYLTAYSDCSRRTFFKMFYDEAREFGYRSQHISQHVGAAVGIASHNGIASDLTGIKNGALIKKDFAIDVSISKYRHISTMQGIGYDSISKNANEAENHIQRILAMYFLSHHPYAKNLWGRNDQPLPALNWSIPDTVLRPQDRYRCQRFPAKLPDVRRLKCPSRRYGPDRSCTLSHAHAPI